MVHLNDFSLPSSAAGINSPVGPSARVAWVLEAVRLDPEALRAIAWALPDGGAGGMGGGDLLRWVADGPDAGAPIPEAVRQAVAGLVRWDGPDWVRVAPDGRPIAGPGGARGRGLRALAELGWGMPWPERMARPWGPRGDGPLGAAAPGLTAAVLAPVFASLRSAAWQAAAVAERRLAEAADALEQDLRAILGDPQADFPSPRDAVRYFFDDRPLAVVAWLLEAPEAGALRRWIGREAARRGWSWRWRDLAGALRAFADRQEALRRKGLAVLRGGPGGGGPPAPPPGGGDAPADDGAPTHGGPRRLGDIWPWAGLPDEAREIPVPPWIRITPEQTLWVRETPSGEESTVEIATGPIAIVGEEVDLGDDADWLRLAWLDRDGGTRVYAAPMEMLGTRAPDRDAKNARMPGTARLCFVNRKSPISP
ncbi:MAG: hypothetical protein K6U87_09245 [Firmicutes bacterium]|nr:hypothetical protein [Bacillota bacterium]